MQPALKSRLRQEGQLTLQVKVIPRAQTSHVAELMANGALKIKVNAIPEDGKANEEVRTVLADFLDVPKRNVEIVRGHTSQQKLVRVQS
ncbi:DUF167 domain-containing protein [Granulicella sp. WH15]|nr:DUF167 domain-containing protein [Granulicella sp. WH15]